MEILVKHRGEMAFRDGANKQQEKDGQTTDTRKGA